MDKIAFVIPTHPPDYHYLYDLLIKMNTNNIIIDIYLVFSSEEHYEKFDMKDRIKKIIVEDIPSNYTPNNTDTYKCFYVNGRSGITSYKKLYALDQLINSTYDYFIVCDSEIDIKVENFNINNINKKINQIFENRIIYAGNVEKNNNIAQVEASANLFSNEDNEIIKHETNNFTLYSWLSDLPVYKKTHLSDFFKKIDYYNKRHLITWFHFEHMMYQYYLIIYHNFKVIDTTPITNIKHSLENVYTNNIDILSKLEDINFGFSWITKKWYMSNPEYFNSKKTFLIYHLDNNKLGWL